MSMIFQRPVRFEEIDAAGVVFFARYLNLCHEAMEHFFAGVEGGYAHLITQRHIGFPAVHVTSEWKAPLRYGDVVRVETSTAAIGTTSAKLRYVMTQARDGSHVATVEHVIVAADLRTMTKLPVIPPDCRAVLEAHLEKA